MLWLSMLSFPEAPCHYSLIMLAVGWMVSLKVNAWALIFSLLHPGASLGLLPFFLPATLFCKRSKLTFFTTVFSVNETSKDKREFYHDQKTKVVVKERKSEGLSPNKLLHK